MKAKPWPLSCPVYLCHLLLFRGAAWWVCCLVLYLPVLTPAHQGITWTTFLCLLRRSPFPYGLGTLTWKCCSFKLSKPIGLWYKDLLWECCHYAINEFRFLPNRLKGGTMKQNRWTAFVAVSHLKARLCFALSFVKERKINSFKRQPGTRDLSQVTPQI